MLFLLFPLSCAQAVGLPAADKYITNGGYALAVNKKLVASRDLNTPFIPASTLKLVTSLAALKILGPTYRFSTRFYLDAVNNLYIQGLGDPFLTSEKVQEIAKTISQRGITKLVNIILDDSGFKLSHSTPGSSDSYNPYDAQCSALAVNFNTLPIRVLQNAKIQSSESQTPYIPLMGKLGMSLASGRYRLNINAFSEQKSIPNALLYTGQLFATLLQANGIEIQGRIRRDKVPKEARLLLTYTATETLTDLIRACLLSSSNFMANQIFLTIGAKQFGYPATWKKGRRAMNDFIKNILHLSDKEILMTEGSGLSMDNRVTPAAMLTVLKQLAAHSNLLPKKQGILMKSGTLAKSGVFCYAGYFTKGKTTASFVLFLNQRRNTRDKILRALYNSQ